jgi:deoxyadenosine/deoxycytidine kinase
MMANGKRAMAFSPNSSSKLMNEDLAQEVLVKPSVNGILTKQDVNALPQTPTVDLKAKQRFTSSDRAEPISMVSSESECEQLPYSDLQGVVIEVEGNIGSGKSTLTRLMKEVVNKDHSDEKACSVFFETINNDFLGAFYSNIKRYSFAFQMYMLTTRMYQMDEGYRQADHEERLVLLDRGAVGDTVFALLNHEAGNMDDDELKIYKSVCKQRMPESISERVDMVMYLDVDPVECHRRVTTERKNDAEDGIPLAYLESVDHCYFHLLMDWFANRKGTYHELNIGAAPRILVLRWDAYGDCRESLKEVQRVMSGERRSPTVQFAAELKEGGTQEGEQKACVVYDTMEKLEAAFALLKQTSAPTEDKAITTAYVNWELEHCNAFRRVSMYYLSVQGNLTFYGESTAITNKVLDGN